MVAALPLQFEDLSAKRLDQRSKRQFEPGSTNDKPLSFGIAALDAALPDSGLPAGSVVELCAPQGLGHVTRLALWACASAQRDSRQLKRTSDWTAWIDPSDPALGSLFAPALLAAGIDLKRLLVVRPDQADIARVSVRLATSRIFRVIVVDRSGLPGASVDLRTRWNTLVRRWALAAKDSGTTILVLSSTAHAHHDRLPTAMRIELTRPNRSQLRLHITKDRKGRLQAPICLPISELQNHAA